MEKYSKTRALILKRQVRIGILFLVVGCFVQADWIAEVSVRVVMVEKEDDCGAHEDSDPVVFSLLPRWALCAIDQRRLGDWQDIAVAASTALIEISLYSIVAGTYVFAETRSLSSSFEVESRSATENCKM